jgi:HlyD family secretion protein
MNHIPTDEEFSALTIPHKRIKNEVKTPFLKRNLVWLFVFLIILVIACSLILLQQNSKNTPLVSQPLQNLETDAENKAIFASGFIVPQRMAAVSSKATGRLKSISFSEGDVVESGALLAELENADLLARVAEQESVIQITKARLNAAQAEENFAEQSLKRASSLKKQDVLSVEVVDSAVLRLRTARATIEQLIAEQNANTARLSLAKTELEYSEIRAPFKGTVLTKNAEVGEVVAPFGSSADARAAVAVIADMNSLMVEADVAEQYLSRISIGQQAAIVLDSLPGRQFEGEVAQIVPTVDRAKATVQVKIRFRVLSREILPQMSARITLK